MNVVLTFPPGAVPVQAHEHRQVHAQAGMPARALKERGPDSQDGTTVWWRCIEVQDSRHLNVIGNDDWICGQRCTWGQECLDIDTLRRNRGSMDAAAWGDSTPGSRLRGAATMDLGISCRRIAQQEQWRGPEAAIPTLAFRRPAAPPASCGSLQKCRPTRLLTIDSLATARLANHLSMHRFSRRSDT